MTKTNMNGGQQTRICRLVTSALKAEFALRDSDAGDRLEQDARMADFLSDIIAAARKGMAQAPKLFSSASTCAHGALPGKKTKKCFTGKLWYYRDSDFDTLLGVDQPSADAGTITVLTPEKSWTFAEAAVSVLNVSPDTPLLTLARLLISRGYTMPLTKLEAMAEAIERGEKTGLITNGYGNFAFTETGNENNPVAVANVYRDGAGRRWNAYVYVFAYSLRWSADRRLVVCNLDPSILGL